MSAVPVPITSTSGYTATEAAAGLLSNITSGTIATDTEDQRSPVLLSIYTAALLSGVLGLALTVRTLCSNACSLTTIAVLNLVFVHFLFLATLPFRIHYYAVGRWTLGVGCCRAVSSMIHVHLYMSFACYVVILVTRLLAFHKRLNQREFHRRTHALLGSLAVWALVAVSVPCAVLFFYGAGAVDDRAVCFKFGVYIQKAWTLHMVVSAAVIAAAVTLTALQAHVLLLLYRQHGRACCGQQEFAAQVKSLCFAGIMVACFVPYHSFRLFYITALSWEHANELFLSLTAFSCLDMLTFVGKGTCAWC